MIGDVKGNQVSRNSTNEGDIAGHNIDKSTNYYVTPQPDKTSPLKAKINQLKADCLKDTNFSQCIERLQHYLNPLNPDDQRDLKTKLTDAGRQDEVYEAEELKESFTKFLVKNNLSKEAQDAYVHILAAIKIQYDSKVKPLIKTKASLQEIEDSVLSIVENMYSELAGTILECDSMQVKGMLYFLTGNCHIDWKY